METVIFSLTDRVICDENSLVIFRHLTFVDLTPYEICATCGNKWTPHLVVGFRALCCNRNVFHLAFTDAAEFRHPQSPSKSIRIPAVIPQNYFPFPYSLLNTEIWGKWNTFWLSCM